MRGPGMVETKDVDLRKCAKAVFGHLTLESFYAVNHAMACARERTVYASAQKLFFETQLRLYSNVATL